MMDIQKKKNFHFFSSLNLSLAHVYDSLFEKFDHDANGAVDLEEFKMETKRMMLAMANGLGFLPVQMLLEEDSFLKKAVEREAMKINA